MAGSVLYLFEHNASHRVADPDDLPVLLGLSESAIFRISRPIDPHFIAFPDILDPIQQGLGEVVDGLGLKGKVGRISIRPDASIRSLGLVPDQGG